MNAHKGFIAPLPSGLIKGKQGSVVWDPQQYVSTKRGEKAPDAANPGLWRQSQLTDINGLFQATDGVYQIRNLGLSNMTIMERKEGITVIDPLVLAGTAKVGMDLYYKNRGRRPVVAVIYTHSHVDRYDGVRDVIDEADVKSGKVRVYTPVGFMKEAVSENIMVGNAANRRANYTYGDLLKPDAKGQVGAGLGTATSAGTMMLIEPANYIIHTGQKEVIDGLTYDLMTAPGSEAPSKMLQYVEEKGMIEVVEDVTRTLRSTYSLRGVRTRDPPAWSRYISDVIGRWGGKTNIITVQHHWPAWGNKSVVKLMKSQRDMCRYINGQTLRMASQRLIHDEIVADFRLPSSLEKSWASRGYYGFIGHDVKAMRVFYFDWFDGNPVALNELLPIDATKKYIDYMGGVGAIMQRARVDYAQGNYRRVAQVTNNIVFAGSSNKEARNLEVDTLEQMSYQVESGPWCNSYLTGAQELRSGVVKGVMLNTTSPDTIKATSPEMFSDYLAVYINGGKVANAQAAFSIDLGVGGGKYKLELENGALSHSADAQISNADTSITLNRATLDRIILKEESLKQTEEKGDV